jgi:DNA-binding response OmpR family regulator
VNDPHFQVALQKAGHKLLLVHQADVLAEASKSGKYDIILVDLQTR